ncbi:RDD family protein [Lentibacillus sediminis]|uniref:RDD family protein n=1 Tax=Lentibacillus sediminis TaxID=1940529 RepID=UPI000C1BC1DC|nr:RDD family protein [Lentibacillus sediminis]
MEQEQVTVKTPEYVSLNFKLAGLGSRAGAMIIDQLILTVLNILIIVGLVFTMQSDFMDITTSLLPLTITIILIFVIYWGYFFAWEYFFGGRTPGKKVLGIRVIQENGHSITLLSSVLRNLLRIIDMLPSAYFVGMIWVFFHSKHKRIGDLVAGTIVVHERGGKKDKKSDPFNKEIRERGLTKESLSLDDWALRSLGMKEWKLLQTYRERVFQVDDTERVVLTRKLAGVLFPKIGLDPETMPYREMEDTLLVLYLILSEEWEFEW